MEMDVMSVKDENLRNSVPLVQHLSTNTMKSKDEYEPVQRISPLSTVAGPPKQKMYLYTQILAAFAVSMGSINMGYSAGYTSSTEKSSMQLSQSEVWWLNGSMLLAALVGGVLGGPLIEYVGRRNTIFATAAPSIVAWLCIATANNLPMILTGHAISGFCVGVASLSIPVYLGEIVQPEVRGSLGLLPTIFTGIGTLIICSAGKYLNWSQLAYLGAALHIPFLVLMMLTPETPRWYITRNDRVRAHNSLQWLRGKDACIEDEMQNIETSQKEENKTDGFAFCLLFSRTYYRPVLISLGLVFFQQFNGTIAVIIFTVQIITKTESKIDLHLSMIILVLVNIGSTFIATVIIDRVGRKILLYISAVSMIVSLGLFGALSYVRDVAGLEVQYASRLAVVCCVVCSLGFSLGFRPIPWLMIGEIFPGKIRGTAASLAIGFSWLCSIILNNFFMAIIKALDAHNVLWLFGGITFVGLFFVIFFVPETQGKSLEEIENELTGRVRRTSSVDNMKPVSRRC